jgi:hypothetical protein
MVASKDDRLVGLTEAKAGGAMSHGDSKTPAEGNRAVENISARL